ncbi:hypothetical protein [Sphingosinicella sp. LY1275]|uniref:hypothetical protein n=1 Tax=Sphingosinicella sp. LY1275 TaxID=3095379 RepID=UPI002ADEC7AA|nr:hypothetical protein [Sphingosinicella sp. LY1275]MEA1015592.1 hypothetical protein [Sphingosinicella sp. LY1275]
MTETVKVRALRQHDTTEGLKAPGDEYERTKREAEALAAKGVVAIVPSKAPKAK